MKRLLFFSLLILPLTVFAQIKIDISPYFVNDSSRVLYWSINGKKLNISDFPFLLEWTKNSLDTIVFIHSSSGTLKYDTTFVLFPKKSNLLLTPDNDGSFDIIRKHSMKRGKNRAKFIVKNTGSDTIICCFASETALVGQIFKESSSSGWLKPFITPYSSNIFHVIVFKAHNLDYYVLGEEEALLFGDKNCSIVGWNDDQYNCLSKEVSFKLRLFKRKKIIIQFDNNTNKIDLYWPQIKPSKKKV
jgi:hypothetical protein